MEVKKSGRVSKFLKDVGIYAIGNIGSKLITFLMIPLYTFFVDSSEFGYYDLCLQAVFLFVPFASLQLRDGAFRFLMDCTSDAQRAGVVSVVFRLLLKSLLVFLGLTLVASLAFDISYLWYSFGMLVSMSLLDVFGQMARGIDQTKVFVASNIVSALLIGVFSVLFVAVFDMGIRGIFLANIVARLAAVGYIGLRVGFVRRFLRIRKENDATLSGKMLKYTLPLLPGVICWWLTGSSDRFFIGHYLSLSENGIYAVALRFASILQIVATIFFQAWQETAFRQYESDDRDRFFSDMFNGYIHLLAIVLLLFAFGLKIMYPVLVADAYAGSAAYLYPLGMAAVLFALSAFMDVGYQCAKETARTLPAIFLAALVNVVSNFILVPRIGVYGGILTSMLTYAVLLAYRICDMRRYFVLHFYRRSLLPVLMMLVGLAAFYYIDSILLDVAYVIAALSLLILMLPAAYRKAMAGKLHRRQKPA